MRTTPYKNSPPLLAPASRVPEAKAGGSIVEVVQRRHSCSQRYLASSRSERLIEKLPVAVYYEPNNVTMTGLIKMKWIKAKTWIIDETTLPTGKAFAYPQN